MSNAALELLKNGMAKEPEPMAEAEEVDIDKLKTHSQINKVVEDYGLETPDNWGAMTVDQKKKYLNETYGDDEDGDTPDTGDEDSADPVASPETPVEDQPEVEIPEPEEEPKAGDALKNMMAEVEEQVSADPEVVEPAAVAEIPTEAPVEPKPKKNSAKKTKPALDEADTAPNEVEDFTNVVVAIENMDRSASLKAVDELSEQSGYSMFKLGGLFARIKSQGWFDPFETFEEWVSSVHGVAKRKAQYYISIYESLVNSEIPFEKCKGVKWSKLKEIAPVMTKETADLWIEKAKNLSVTNLIEEVKAHKKAAMAAITGEQADGAETIKKVITRSFKLYEDQAEVVETAISKAKSNIGAEENNQALEAICLEYLSGGGGVNQNSLAEAIKVVGFEKTIELVAELFPEHDITIG